MKLQWTLTSSLTVIALMACAPFKADQESFSQAEALGSKLWLQGEITQQEYYQRLGAQIVEPSSSQEQDQGLSLYQFDKSISFSFAAIGAAVLDGLQTLGGRLGYPENCNYELDRNYQLGATTSYNCGEIPFGEITDRETKKAIDLTIGDTTGKEEGFDYRIRGFQVHFEANRQQRASQTTLSTLNQKGDESVPIAEMLFQSTFLKVEPQDGFLVIRVCTFAPGMDITGVPVETTGRFERKQWGFIPLRATGRFRIQPGRVVYDHAEICGAFSVQVVSENLDVDVSVIGFEEPKLFGLRFEGVKSEGDVDGRSLLKFINFFTRIFNFNIEKEIAKEVNKEIERRARKEFTIASVNEIQSGRWLERFFSEQFLRDQLVEDLDQAISESLQTKGPATPISMNQRVVELCQSASLGVPPPTRPNFQATCENSLSIELKSFVSDPLSKEWGCYDHFFNPLETTPSQRASFWWVDRCEVDNLVTVTVPQPMIPLFDCLLESSQNGRDSAAAEACLPEIQFTSQQIEIEPLLSGLLKRFK